jgi:hypothetical protein
MRHILMPPFPCFQQTRLAICDLQQQLHNGPKALTEKYSFWKDSHLLLKLEEFSSPAD